MSQHTFFSDHLDEEIEKAICYIKVCQFHSGFSEISRPEQGGDIEVSIKLDPIDPQLLHVSFSYVTVPGGVTIIKQNKVITRDDLSCLARKYEENKQEIDEELAGRALTLSNYIEKSSR